MVLIVTALMAEAASIIEYFKLKRDMDVHAYPVYKSPEIALIVSGVGKMKSAMAAVFLLANCNVLKADISEAGVSTDDLNANILLLNIGFCGTSSNRYNPGDLLVINKITDIDTGKDYYPDVYFGWNLPKEALLCFSRPVREAAAEIQKAAAAICEDARAIREDATGIHLAATDVRESAEDYRKVSADFRGTVADIFCDMESAGFMEVSQKFFYAHQTAILKVVSDRLTPEKLDKKLLLSYIERNIPLIEQIIEEMKQLNTCIAEPLAEPSGERENYILGVISHNLHFTVAMEQILLKEVKKAKQKGLQPLKTLESFAEIKANSKSEGKKILGKIIESLRQRPV